ncbi:MAG TPA: DegQ family serine endoprotease [Casimicrobiaceae bacterium]|nr:DegQ family serine endoprotease [Casimicrobiaceae bacterium]
MTVNPFKRTAVAVALMAALGLGAVAAERVVPDTTAAAPAAVVTSPAPAQIAAQAPINTRGLPSFADIVEQQGAAVVQVRASKDSKRVSLPRAEGMPEVPPELAPFFRNMPRSTPRPALGTGSGFIVGADGIVLTNAHVVADSDEVIVKLTDQREFKAKVLGSDATTDVAVLKIEAKALPVVKLGDPTKTRVGDWVVAIGTPYGLDNTVTSGIVSAKSRSLPGEGVVPFIQTDAAVNPGNSGGPLFNLTGEVIGINSQIFSRTGGFMGVAFAIPIDVALNVADQIRTTGKVTHGRLGVTVQPVDQALADNFGLPGPKGALVGSVQKDSPAAAAGVEAGDVILSFNGKPVVRSSDLPYLVAATKPGSAAKVEVWRDGKARVMDVKVAEREGPKKVAGASSDDAVSKGKLGVSVRPLTPEEKKTAGNERGVVVEQVGGAAERAGIRSGDVIISVNRAPINSPEELKAAVDKAGKSVALLIRRDDAQIFVPVTIG